MADCDYGLATLIIVSIILFLQVMYIVWKICKRTWWMDDREHMYMSKKDSNLFVRSELP